MLALSDIWSALLVCLFVGQTEAYYISHSLSACKSQQGADENCILLLWMSYPRRRRERERSNQKRPPAPCWDLQ